ncbi:MAG: 2-hydroxychromene-2-carboxylate isomerase [Burkholderiaceae bacterium]
MDAASIDFLFDFSSPYSYIAAERIDALAARYGHAVHWRPMLLGVIFRETGGRPLTDLHDWKTAYYLEDFVRSARHQGLPYRHPSRFPQPTQAAARAMIWLQQAAPELARPFALEVFRALFVHDADVTLPETLAGIARSLGIDPEALIAATQAPEMKAALVANCEAATAARVVGAPTFIVDGEKFWGRIGCRSSSSGCASAPAARAFAR